MDNVEDVQITILRSFYDMLKNFVVHLPFVFGSIAVLLLAWALTTMPRRFFSKLISGWSKRESVKQLVVRLVTIVGWVLGLLLSAIVLFPGLTPAKALGGLGLLSIAVGLAFKDIYENFFAGVLILWRLPFERGDIH